MNGWFFGRCAVWFYTCVIGIADGWKLLGEYGAISDWTLEHHKGLKKKKAETKKRVTLMMNSFHIREFQFYEVVDGFSLPPPVSKPWFNRNTNTKVNPDIVKSYIAEAKAHAKSLKTKHKKKHSKGDKHSIQNSVRCWLRVPLMEIETKLLKDAPNFTEVDPSTVVDPRTKHEIQISRVVPNRGFAKWLVPKWAKFAEEMEFSGIHWFIEGGDFDGFLDSYKVRQDVPGFLEEAHGILQERSLEQTINLNNGLYDNFGARVVAFPYIEITRAEKESWLSDFDDDNGGAVYVNVHGEQRFGRAGELTPVELLIWRWVKAGEQNCKYFAIADGPRRIVTDNFAVSKKLQPEEVERIRYEVFVTKKPTVEMPGDSRTAHLLFVAVWFTLGSIMVISFAICTNAGKRIINFLMRICNPNIKEDVELHLAPFTKTACKKTGKEITEIADRVF